MAETKTKTSFSTRNTLLVAALLAIILGSSTGFATAFFTRPSPATQTREVYLFPYELGFNSSNTGDVKFSYIYIPDKIIVNRGDTVVIHFYDTTDDSHTFTMEAPYVNDVVLAAATTTVTHNKTITFVASSGGMFTYHCRFHGPQMVGTLIVQG